MLELWWSEAVEMPSAAGLATLSLQESERLARFRRPQDRAEYATAHVLLRTMLTRFLDTSTVDLGRRPCPCCGEPHGRPYVRTPSTRCELSLSHGGGLVTAVLCDEGPVGVDTERLLAGSATDGVVSMLHPAEREEVRRAPAELRRALLTRIWVRKEAYLKAIGTGLGRDASLDYVAPGSPDLLPSGWAFHEIELRPCSWAAVCAPAAAGLPTVRHVTGTGTLTAPAPGPAAPRARTVIGHPASGRST